MTIKRIDLRTQDKMRVFRRLVAYVRSPAKVAWTMASDRLPYPEHAGWLMTGTAAMNRRVKKPAAHFVFSWGSNEKPTPKEMQAAVRAGLASLGLLDHEWIAAAHRDASHTHVHVVANRVHPVTFRPAYDGWSHLRAQRTAQEINRRFGWPGFADKTQTYEINGVPFTRAELKPSVPRRGTGGWSAPLFQEWLALEVRPALLAAITAHGASWQSVHRTLRSFGLQYAAQGAGAVVSDPDDQRLYARPSRIGRFASRARLELRLGPYQAPEDSEDAAVPPSRHFAAAHAAWFAERPADLRQRYLADLARIAETMDPRRPKERWHDQRASERDRRRQLRDVQRKRRAFIRTCASVERPGLRLVAAVEAERERKDLQDEIATERASLKAEIIASPRMPSWRVWLIDRAKAGDKAAALAVRQGRPYRRLEDFLAEHAATLQVRVLHRPELGASTFAPALRPNRKSNAPHVGKNTPMHFDHPEIQRHP